MLTISPIKNSAGAAIYFAKEDSYYLSEVDTKENSIWWGAGAEKLGLSNKKVVEKDLQNIMEGRLPNGVTIGLQKDGSIKHRAGYDLCFHAPKSVSILALDGGDRRFYEAHFEAVKETIKAMERECVQARVYNGKKVSFENTQNITVASIRHTASRSLDPHLHHHVLVMNATERQDKTWRALASNMTKDKRDNKAINGFLERIYRNQIYYGLIYRSALANKIKNLGCEIEMVGKHGMWEIKGVPKEARIAMSKRRKEIEELMGKFNYHSFKAADIVSSDSRKNKPEDIKLEDMKQTWKYELSKAGFSSKEFLNELEAKFKDKSKNELENKSEKGFEKNKDEKSEKLKKTKKPTEGHNLKTSENSKNIDLAINTVKDATWYLSQYKLKLDYTKIISQALEFSIGETTHRDIVFAANQLIKDGFLIPLDKHDNVFVTEELIETEKAIMELVDDSKNKWSSFKQKDNSSIVVNEIKKSEVKENEIKKPEIKQDEIQRYGIKKNEIEKNKKDAISILQSKHRLGLVESSRLDNKDLITNILELAESSGKTVRVLSPNRLIANDINENITRIKPNNIWRWLVSLGKPEVGESIAGFKYKYKEETDLPSFLLRLKQGKDVIVVNNAEVLSCNDMKTILELTEKTNAKVIFLQDTTDRRGFGAGNPIETLKQAGIERFKLKTPELEKGSGKNQADASGSFSMIPELKIIKDNNKRILQLAKEYAQKYDRENTIVLVGSKKQLKTTNEAIRNELKEQGKISNLEYSISVLNPVYMSKPEAILAHKYHQNMIIRFYNGGGGSDDWNVSHCDRRSNILKLIQGKRKRMAWNPKKQQNEIKYGVFKKEILQIAKGDKLIATSNMYDLEIKNGTKFIIDEVNERFVKLLCDTRKAGKIRKINNTDKAKEIKKTEKSKVVKIRLDKLKNSHFQYDYVTTINKSLKSTASNVIADFKAYALDKPVVNELTKRAKKTLTIFSNDGKIAQKRFSHIPIKLTAVDTLLDAGKAFSNVNDKTNDKIDEAEKTKNKMNNKTNDDVERVLDSRTISEIKSDLKKAIGVLRDQYDFRSKDERKAVDFAIEKISSRNAGFAHEDLMQEALVFVLEELISKQNKKVTKEDIERIIEEKRVSGDLVIGKHPADGVKWTTREMLELERSIIANLKKGENKLEFLLDPKNLKIPTEEIKFTKDQKNAISLIATTKDQYVMVQGYAGTGKTAMFSQVHKMLKEAKRSHTQGNVKMLGLAPTHKAVKELKAIGIKAQSLKSFLIEQRRLAKGQDEQEGQRDQGIQDKQEKQKGPKNMVNRGNKAQNSQTNILDNKLIILDEISMVPNKDFAEFIEITDKSKSHVVLSGDIDQYLPIGSGKPIDITQKSGVLKTAFLKEIVRQKNPNIKEAVKSTIGKNYAHALDKIEKDNPQNYIERINPEADLSKNRSILNQSDLDQSDLDFTFFKNLQKSIIEIDNNEISPEEKTLEQMVAEDFLTRTPEVRDKTVIIVHANEDRAVINKYIRDGLKEQGVIAKTGVMVNCLTAKNFTDAEYKSLKSYNRGDVVKLASKHYHVAALDLEARSLLLKDGSGKTRYFYPEKEVNRYNMELYQNTKKELAVGDVIRLSKSDKKRGLFANFEYRVKEIDKKQVTLESKDDRNNRGRGRSRNWGIGEGIEKKEPHIILNHRKLKDSHWDYAQTVTGYGIQGASKKYVIAFEVSYRKFLANVRSFYISISRAIEHIVIYTDNQSKFLKQLLRNPGDKYSALEVAGELKESSKYPKYPSIEEIKKNTQAIKKQINADFYDIKEIKRLLENQAETVVENLLGKPNNKLSSSSEWRYGNKGSLVIGMASNKLGLWHNFETGESGNLISLIQKELGLNFPDTLKYVSDRFGGFQNHILTLSKANKGQAQPGNTNDIKNINTKGNNVKNAKISSEKSKTSEYAQKLVKESLPITGTIVEKYLKEHRGIKNIDSNDIRYHPKVFAGQNEKQRYLPAMLSLGRDKNGNVQCVQATYLNPKTANKAGLTVKKRTYSSPSGALVSLQKYKDGINHKNKNNNKNDNKSKNRIKNNISFVAEGVETGLSVKDATTDIKNSQVVVTLGKSNFTKIDPKSIGNKVIFCLDNDGLKTLTDSTIHKAAERLVNFGKEVFIAIPKFDEKDEKSKESERNGKDEKNAKLDFNDISRTLGTEAVRNSLNGTIPYQEWKNNTVNITLTNINEKSKNGERSEISLNSASFEKVIKKDPHFDQVYASLLKKPEIGLKIDLNAATKFINSDRLDQKQDFTKYLRAYERMQNKSDELIIQKDQKSIGISEKAKSLDMDISNTQKILSKTEKEIY